MNKQHPLKVLKLIHTAMLIGQVIFAGISIFLFSQRLETAQMKEQDKLFQLIAIAVAAAGFLIGINIFKKQIRLARESNTTAKQKFDTYKKYSLLLWALLEAPILLCIVFFYLTANYAFIILAAALLFLFIIFGPSREKIKLHLTITDAEIDELR